jgi:transcriptional regulator with XRE-family HTH domain
MSTTQGTAQKRRPIPYAGWEPAERRARDPDHPKPVHHRSNPIDRARVHELNAKGLKRIEIAREIGCTPGAVTKILGKLVHVEEGGRPSRCTAPAWVEEAKRLKAEGWKDAAIARRLTVSSYSIRYWLRPEVRERARRRLLVNR